MKVNDLYTSVTNEVIRQLEEGVPPWTRPWKDAKARGIGMIPSNLVTGRLYSGGNILLLWLYGVQRGFEGFQYCTFNQLNGLNASVRKGEKATHVLFTKHIVKKDEATDEDRRSTVVKTYAVFHSSQIENLDPKYLEAQQFDDREATHDKALELMRGSRIDIEHGGNKASYYPRQDKIHMPPFGSFENENAYWGVLYHEMTHATGHEDRLKRSFGKRFGDNAYAFEELVAELGSAFLCGRLGIEPTFRSAAYIESWLKVLKADNRAILSAASYAGHAADWLWEKAFYAENEDTPDVERQKAVA
jgi:antirestriction protein ArdC